VLTLVCTIIRIIPISNDLGDIMPVFSKDKDDAIVEFYKSVLSVSKTAKHFECCANSVYKLLRENGAQRDLNKGSLAFTDFSKEEDSYFYGLLLSDGNISSKGNTITLRLQETDKYMIEKLKNYIGCSNKISKYTKDTHVSYALSFSSYTIKERLLSQNFTPRKSTKEKLPNFDWLSDRHFWRGMIDGDGSLYYNKNSPKLNMCGSKEILEGFNKFCQVNCFTKPKKLYETKVDNFFTVLYAGEEALRIMKLLYDDSRIFLLRKKERVELYEKIFVPKSPNKNIKVLPSGRFNVRIGFNGNKITVGTYDTYEEALAARLEAEIKYQGKIRNDIHSSTAT